MKKLTLESLPEFVGTMAEQMNRIERSLIKIIPPKDISKKKYNLAEAANYCGMAESTLRTYIYKRQVGGTKFGKAWLFLEKDLDKFIEDFRKPTAKELESESYIELTGQ